MFVVARVNDIILDEGHPDYRHPDDIGAIKFTEIQEQTTETSNSNNWAKPYHFNISHYPLINEVVQIYSLPDHKYNETGKPIDYYLSPISLHQHISENELPDYIPTEGPIPSGNYFIRNDSIRRLKPYEGDLIIQGRLGNSIRFGSTIDNHEIINSKLKSPWSNEGTIGNPITVITNGLKESFKGDGKEGENTTIEDINKDKSSIYLCSQQQITNLIVASTHNDSFRYDKNIYKKEELLINNDPTSNDVQEDINMTNTEELPAKSAEETNELSKIQYTDTAYYDIAPTEQQKIAIENTLTLPGSYIIPDTVNNIFLNESMESGFNKIHNIESRISRDNSLNNYPGVDVILDSSLTEETIWNNLILLNKNIIKPLVETFGVNSIRITSAYRSEQVNTYIGGAPNSQHIKGYAVDLISINHPSSDLFNWCSSHLPEWNQLIWEYPERGNFINKDFDFSWIHISYIEGNNPKIQSLSSQIEDVHTVFAKTNELSVRKGKYTHNVAPYGLNSLTLTDLNLL